MSGAGIVARAIKRHIIAVLAPLFAVAACAALTAPDPQPLPDGGAYVPPSGEGGSNQPPPPVQLPNRLDPPYAGPMNPKWVVELKGGSPGPRVNHGLFWPPDKHIGAAWWEAWIMPLPGHSGYFVSDGYGGGHAMLIGTNHDGTISGNMWGGPMGNHGAAYSNQSIDGMAVGEWVHVTVAYERTRLNAILVYINGILSGFTPRPHGRWSFPANGGAGDLYVGGSDHQNFGGRIAWMRAFDNDVFPRDPSTFTTAFRPRREALPMEQGPGVVGGAFVPNATMHADFLASYQVPPGTKVVPDLAVAGSMQPMAPRVTPFHPGIPEFSVPPAKEPMPVFVEDPTAPFGPGPQPPRVQVEVKPAAVPYAARIFDSFARPNQDLTLDTPPTLGMTEAGDLGRFAWQTLPDQPFGIRNSFAVFLGTKDLSPAWVDSGVSEQDIEIAHGGHAGFRYTGGAAVVFRMADPANLWMAIVSEPLTLTLRKIVAGEVIDIGRYDLPPTWYGVINVRALGDVIQVNADKADGRTVEVVKVTDTFNRTATKVGFASAGGSFTRVKSFVLLANPR